MLTLLFLRQIRINEGFYANIDLVPYVDLIQIAER